MTDSVDQLPTTETSGFGPHTSRLRGSTWLVAGFVLLVMVLLNYAAFIAISHDFTFERTEYPPDAGGSPLGCLEHGWPWTYARRMELLLPQPNRKWSAGLLDFYPEAWLGDAAQRYCEGTDESPACKAGPQATPG